MKPLPAERGMSLASWVHRALPVGDLSKRPKTRMRIGALSEGGAAVPSRRTGWGATIAGAVFVLALLALAAANLVTRAQWHGVDDGTLWVSRPEGVTAAELSPRSPAGLAGLQPGDLLIAIDGRPIETPGQVAEILQHGSKGTAHRYTLLRLGSQEMVEVSLAPIPRGSDTLYFILAAVGIFTLLVGAWVRLGRPSDQASLHFLWLCTAFFGVFAFSFSGRLDRLDWIFYWGDVVALLLLPPLFLHFTLVFPDRARVGLAAVLSRHLPLLYLPAVALGGVRVVATVHGTADGVFFTRVTEGLERIEPLYLSLFLLGGLAVLLAARGEVRTVTSRRQLRWIIWGTALGAGPFALAYAFPYALGVQPTIGMELFALPLGLMPLSYASAIVRYRLLDVEVIVKRVLVYIAALSAIAAMYALLLGLAGWIWLEGSHQYNSVIAVLATLVVVLLARPVQNGIQSALDRAFYRDRYDYRRALLGFARDLNADLDLDRMVQRLLTRVGETFLVERIALMLGDDRLEEYSVVRSSGLASPVSPLSRSSTLGARLAGGHAVVLEDTVGLRRFDPAEVDFWREQGIHYFVPCVSKEGTIAVLAIGRKDSGEPLNSEDVTLLAAVAGQVATALENARLYGQLQIKALELARMREFSENILESLDEGLVVVDVDSIVVRWNRALERLTGISAGDATGRALHDILAPSFVDALHRARADRLAGATIYRLALPTPRWGSERLLVNATIVPLLRPDGEDAAVAGSIVIIRDVTSRVRLEEQLQISDKMASIGLLAAGVAHEINTPLTGISSYAQILLEGSEEGDPRTKLLEKIERQTFRAAKIVNGLLNLSRPTGPGVERLPVDVNSVINDVLSLLEHQFKVSRIQVRRQLASPPPIVRGHEFKLQQVFLNLFINARDAMPKGGWLSVETHIEGDSAVLKVSDTGAGIHPDHISRIYDPFFTTKAMGQGTGLGLSITYGIVREHDGTISCESSPGKGSRFTLSLPLASAAGVQSQVAAN
jgi:two-component system, NtrC family, sensor kinase